MTSYKIYVDRCTITGGVYIGYTKDSPKTRWQSKTSKARKHHSNTKLENAIRKYGEDCWEHTVICETWSHDYALELEIYFIELYDSYNTGYNSSIGGETPTYTKLSDDHKRNISAGLKRSYASGYMKPVSHSLELREKMSKDKQVGIWKTPHGQFGSRRLAAQYYNTSTTNLSNWCKLLGHMIITKGSVTCHPHIFVQSDIGKTFNEIGFKFTPFSDNES